MDVSNLFASVKEARARAARVRRRRRVEAPGRALFFSCLWASPCVLGCALGVAVGVRHWRRSADLGPLLNAIADDNACTNQQTTTCALKLTGEESNRFDLHPAENPLLGFIWEQVVSQNLFEMREVLSGAHVIIHDPEGSSYKFLSSLPGAQKRASSTHRSDRAQYDIPEGYVVASLLIGYLDDSTWFQLEGAPWDLEHNLWRSLGHILDTSEYALSLMTSNVGPLGTSRYTDKRPLWKDAVVPISKACPSICDGYTPGDHTSSEPVIVTAPPLLRTALPEETPIFQLPYQKRVVGKLRVKNSNKSKPSAAGRIPVASGAATATRSTGSGTARPP